jgi:putative endonuclease
VATPIRQGTSGGWRVWLRQRLNRWLGRDRAEPAHLAAGNWGEDVACAQLRRDGFKILGRRVRVGRRDEIDILAREGADTLVFVEVKTRADESFGRPGAAVDRDKRRNLSRAALRYLKALRQRPKFFRFDVVEVIGHPGGAAPVVRHNRNAFQVSKPYHTPWG